MPVSRFPFLCGSGLIDALAVLLKAGIIDENGTIFSGQELPILFRSYVFEVEAEETARYAFKEKV